MISSNAKVIHWSPLNDHWMAAEDISENGKQWTPQVFYVNRILVDQSKMYE